jgi:hypothetical protein
VWKWLPNARSRPSSLTPSEWRLGSDERITLRAKLFGDLARSEIVSVRPNKQWTYAAIRISLGRSNPDGSMPVHSTSVHFAWSSATCGTRRRSIGAKTANRSRIGQSRSLLAAPRPQFEMQQVLPGEDPDDPFSDPITESNDYKDAGDFAGAEKLLHDMCEADLRCLDAHAHLGNLDFEHRPKEALRHYEIGMRIGELSLRADFDGVLLWRMIDNRPFLRCLHGYGLCLWRAGDFDGAHRLFERMPWLNAPDNQGTRFLIVEVQARRSCESQRDR